ncbi:MAG: hypothetical protein POELPBGB_03501 [Bacteroidia bacterium]|nr:hypothetical protein [Bacteroidia bacterium]
MNRKNKTAIWIDHKHAVIINFNEKNEEKIYQVESGFEGKEREDGEDRNKNSARMGKHFILDERGFENRQIELLRKFYLEVILRISEDSEVYIMGPASAKDELATKIRNYNSLRITITKIEAADRMSEKEVAAKAREYFHVKKLAA